LPKRVGELCRDDTSDHVGRTTRRERDDQSNRPGGILLSARNAGSQRSDDKQ
jgi:hypothetical protein